MAEVSDLSAPENRFERGFGELLEVYTRIDTPDGTPLLFETYQLASSIADRRRELAVDLRPGAGGHPGRAGAADGPDRLGRCARRVRATQRERERLMQRAIDVLRPRASPDRGRPARRAGAGARGPLDAAVGRGGAGRRPRGRRRAPVVGLGGAWERADAPVGDRRASTRPTCSRSGSAAALVGSRGAPAIRGRRDRRSTSSGAGVRPRGRGSCSTARAQEALRNVEEHADARHVSCRRASRGGPSGARGRRRRAGHRAGGRRARPRGRAHGPCDPGRPRARRRRRPHGSAPGSRAVRCVRVEAAAP